MTSTVAKEFRKFGRHFYTLKIILKDTLKYLEEIRNNFVFGADLKNDLFKEDNIPSLEQILVDCYPAIVVFGQNCHAKAIFVNYLLDQPVLPLYSSCWKWVRLSYGHTKETFLTLRQEYEIVEKLKTHETPWTTVPESDIIRTDQELPNEHCPALEIKLNCSFLKDKVNIIVPPDSSSEVVSDVLLKGLDNILPVIIYVVSDHTLSDLHIREIKKIKKTYQDLPALFFVVSDDTNSSTSNLLTESEQHSLGNKLFVIKNQLVRLGYIRDNGTACFNDPQMEHSLCALVGSSDHIIGDYECKSTFIKFLSCAFKSYLLGIASKLSKVHNHCLKKFILTAFDMAREIQITPQRIKYAQATEGELYKNLMKIAGDKQEEIIRIIHSTLQDMKLNTAEVLDGYYRDYDGSHCPNPQLATMEIQQVVLNKLGSLVARQLVQSVGCLQESYTGTLQRCIENLEKSCYDQEGNLLASDAVTQIISAAYSIELKSSTSLSVIHSFMERLRKLLYRFQMPWTSCSHPDYDQEWKNHVVANMVESLNSSKLAKSVSTQFQEIIKSSHETFQTAMRSLENRLSGKLEQTEEQRISIRKQYAPRFARLALESTSLCDLVRFGMPIQTREIGRGQYGVVFACESWGGVNPCAVKSVVPPDDRHWNDLAMEFYYTRTITEHPRIVKLRGSVIDYQYGGGCSSAVLLVMERMTRDLYCGLRSGLTWKARLQIAIDVIEGIRYLHSQGLVHRDIKLKNVLLDNEDRAKLTDFGFCIPEAMMSGSIVGTPVHMAPELLSGHYDSSVDVYAFGILFWYICANQVSLPCVFEQFHNKEQLWTSVRKGVRPECLPQFSGECWALMEQCWAAEPALRPLLGNVQPRLETIRRATVLDTAVKSTQNCSPPYQRHKVEYVESSIYDQFPLVQMREF